MSTYTRLMVVQAADSEAAQLIERDFCQAARHLHQEPGFEHAEVLTEANDWLLVFLTVWNSCEEADQFGSSPLYGLLQTAIQARIVGTPIVRIFKRSEGRAA